MNPRNTLEFKQAIKMCQEKLDHYDEQLKTIMEKHKHQNLKKKIFTPIISTNQTSENDKTSPTLKGSSLIRHSSNPVQISMATWYNSKSIVKWSNWNIIQTKAIKLNFELG